ncbi:hypothetical protein FHR22_001957 [Sphingopyxis panaciterrae]|uniref:hypothetical protein n=1 Tax=Sphingopyxis panaciterrae TaxID=363841 RepID=UPI00142388D4|nr:hypothetical protein [Sphingopyxis panaciterrae]NIJ37273.1 hypothetical protein [Sphingopyxis panaciterrae]
MSAIAAFLALSAPAAFAQEAPTVPMTPPVAAPPPVASPPTIAPPSTTAPVAASQTAQPPAPKPVIRVPLDLPAAEPAEPAPKVAEKAAAPAPKLAERAAPAPRAAERTVAAAPAATPEPATPVTTDIAPLASEATPITTPVMAPTEPVAEPAPLPAERAVSNDSFPWELAGGAAALLIVGGAGLTFARRRRRADTGVADEGMSYEAMKAAEAVPYSPPREEVVAPSIRNTPSFAAAPSGSMGRHEALALAGPTPDNPFATLKKRLARARFLDSQERAEYDATLATQKDMSRKPVSAWEIAQRPAPAAAKQEVRRPEPGRGQTAFRPGYSNN